MEEEPARAGGRKSSPAKPKSGPLSQLRALEVSHIALRCCCRPVLGGALKVEVTLMAPEGHKPSAGADRSRFPSAVARF